MTEDQEIETALVPVWHKLWRGPKRSAACGYVYPSLKHIDERQSNWPMCPLCAEVVSRAYSSRR